ncbi:hypothetical protein SAMD00023353_2900280 [Rosellinia necatrix]|uniref:Uncharacterized protein n=1 Tax=Rosellinia necatrix TaxID=77044 RepID=A0A1W2TJH2_ROSNE|nr:hypothetical protein SAMD00023353_2900280 [Rosellinia necatrix]
MDGERDWEGNGGRNGGRNRDRTGDKEKDRERDTSANAAQSRRPPYLRRDTANGTDSQTPQQQQQQQQQQPHYRPKHQKRVVGAGAARVHARVPSSKGLHKSHPQAAAKLRSRASSPEPERPPLAAHPNRRTTSDLRLTTIAPESPERSNPHSPTVAALNNLKQNISQSNLVSNLASNRNRSHAEISQRSTLATNIKRSSSHKDVQKLKGVKNQVHFDLGNDENDDGNDDEWVDASASASPYLSRRGSVASGGQSPAKPPSTTGNGPESQTSPITDDHLSDHHIPSPTRQAVRQSNYITSRLLQRTPSQGAPPQMSTEVVSVPPPSGPPSLYGTPKTSTLGASGPEELVSRFVDESRPSSGGHGEGDSYFVASHAPARRNEGSIRRPQSLSNLDQAGRDSASEDETALAPRSRKPMHRAAPASQSRTQQKLNLQRASSSIEPAQAGPSVGIAGAGLLVGSPDYEHRDPRIGKLLERTGMEYLVVRRYQNPIARSITRLSQLPGADKNRRILKQNGTSGTTHGTMPSDLDAAGRHGLSQSLTHMAQSRPVTPRRTTSVRTVGPRSSYGGDDERLHGRMSGSSYADGNDDELSTLLRNLWDKSTDLSASQE